MNVYEFLRINESQMRVMHSNGIEPSMVGMLPAYEEYMRMMADGDKKEYIYAELKRQFGMSRTTVYRMITRFSADISLRGI